MKFVIATAALLLALGTTAPAYAQHDKGDGGHSQGEHSQATHSQAGHSQATHSQAARPAQQQHTQQAARTGRPQTNAGNRSQQGNGGGSQARVQQTRSTTGNGGYARNGGNAGNRGNGGNRGNYAHGRISDDRYASNFGSGHSFRVSRGDYDRRRFEYGGYSFGFIDPWPLGWGYSDDVYVVYDDGGYFMYDRFHPGFRISVNIL
ncbi:MAG: hypothetical protein ACLQMT_01400 [Candidatus Acidiferrales bacterium]